MGGQGPVPKEHRHRSRNDPVLEKVAVELQAPIELPNDLLPVGETWHPATLRWWNTWVESPLGSNLPAVDWRELETCAVLHHEFMRKRTFTLASELRLRVAKFGATPEDRMRLRLKVTPAEPTVGTAPGITNIASRRQLLDES